MFGTHELNSDRAGSSMICRIAGIGTSLPCGNDARRLAVGLALPRPMPEPIDAALSARGPLQSLREAVASAQPSPSEVRQPFRHPGASPPVNDVRVRDCIRKDAFGNLLFPFVVLLRLLIFRLRLRVFLLRQRLHGFPR